MKGLFWNIRGLNRPGNGLSLGHVIRDRHLDFVTVQETKKEQFHPSFLKNLTTPSIFQWEFMPTKGTARGILVGVREEVLMMSNVQLGNFSISCMILDKMKNFSWKLIVVYGSPYDEGEIEFIDELT
jgi:hypothetical protein